MDEKPIGPMSRRKPTTAGHYIWRRPEAERHGYYNLRVEVACEGDDVLRVFSDSTEVCTLAEASGGSWGPANPPRQQQTSAPTAADRNATPVR